MNKLLLKNVQVKRIDFDSETITVDDFSKKMLDWAAKDSLIIGGFAVPPTLLKVGGKLNPPYYKVLSGHFQCYAARIAQSLDPLKGKTIPAIVISDDDPNLKTFIYQMENCNFYVVR